MTLSGGFDDPLSTTDVLDHSINLNSLYCSHLWRNSHLRNAIITAPCRDRNVITYCYTCKGKIRKYEVKSPRSFTPHNHSTPNKEIITEIEEPPVRDIQEYPIDKNTEQSVCYNNSVSKDSVSTNLENKQRIPSISQQIDSSFRQKYISYEMEPTDVRRQRLRKSLRGFGCIVNFATTDSSVKKRTQIQACSISIMIIAIVIISFILVNFTTPNVKGMTNKMSTTAVPTKNVDFNETASAITNIYSDLPPATEFKVTDEYFTTTESTSIINTDNTSPISVISKIRKNIRTYPKVTNKKEHSAKPKDVNNRDLSDRFCSCQKDEICMLDENSGTSICRKPRDDDDPTGKRYMYRVANTFNTSK